MNYLVSGLKAIRKDLDNTQLEMASELGVSISTYKRYENGDMSIPGSVLKIISEMNYNINWLLTGEGDMLQPVNDKKFLSDLSNLSPELKEKVIDFVAAIVNK